MKDKFTELAGYSPDDASDIGIRIRVLAGEVYSINTAVDWLKRQTFAQTAYGSKLELRAQERGLTRKPAVAAHGTLTFSRSSTLWYNAEIPSGTVCSTSGDGAVRYITTQNAILEQGSLSVDVPAQAAQAGSAGNTQSGTITVMVTPNSSIQSVTNAAAFAGGEDSESDDSLRQRLLQCYKEVSNGSNQAWYRQAVLQYPGIQSVGIMPGTGTVTLYLGGRGCTPSDTQIQQISNDLNRKRELGLTVTVKKARRIAVAVTATIAPKSGIDSNEAVTACKTAVQNFFNDLNVGDGVLLSALCAALFATEKIKDCKFTSDERLMAQNQLAVQGLVTITAEG